jgi:DNA-binding LacI/PurR family transcriptional regulator
MPTSVTDVARHAGVSVSTVSYVLSGNRPISAKTKQRVLASIAELGFQPHAGAQSIRARATNIFALVMPIERDVRADVQMRFVLGVLRAARAKGKNLLLLPAEDGMDELARLTASSAIDGVLAMEIRVHDPRVATLAMLSKPVVLIGTPQDPQRLAHVDFDFAAAGAFAPNTSQIWAISRSRISPNRRKRLLAKPDTPCAHRTARCRRWPRAGCKPRPCRSN